MKRSYTQPPLPLPKTKAEAGRMGGLATAARHGVEHMREIGRRGAIAFHARYTLRPEGTNQLAVVNRTTGAVVGYIN